MIEVEEILHRLTEMTESNIDVSREGLMFPPLTNSVGASRPPMTNPGPPPQLPEFPGAGVESLLPSVYAFARDMHDESLLDAATRNLVDMNGTKNDNFKFHGHVRGSVDFYTPREKIDPETIAAEAATLPASMAAEFYADLAVFKPKLEPCGALSTRDAETIARAYAVRAMTTIGSDVLL